jgi:hypothetical membrane protein
MKTEQIAMSGKKSSDIKRAGLLFTFAGSAFILLLFILEALYPGYSVHANAISDLLATTANTSIIGEPIGFAISIAWIAGGYYLLRRTGKKGLLILNLLPGTGFLLAVLSPENINVAIHSVGAVLAFFPGAIVMILAFRTIKTQFRYFSLFFGLVSFVGIVFEFGGYYSPLVQQTLGPGGWERVIVYPLLIWLVGYGNYLLTISKEGSR